VDVSAVMQTVGVFGSGASGAIQYPAKHWKYLLLEA
jgi:hypothetical protein